MSSKTPSGASWTLLWAFPGRSWEPCGRLQDLLWAPLGRFGGIYIGISSASLGIPCWGGSAPPDPPYLTGPSLRTFGSFCVHICIYMYVCIYIYIYMHIRLEPHACRCIYACICICIGICIHVYIYIYIYVCVCTAGSISPYLNYT